MAETQSLSLEITNHISNQRPHVDLIGMLSSFGLLWASKSRRVAPLVPHFDHLATSIANVFFTNGVFPVSFDRTGISPAENSKDVDNILIPPPHREFPSTSPSVNLYHPHTTSYLSPSFFLSAASGRSTHAYYPPPSYFPNAQFKSPNPFTQDI